MGYPVVPPIYYSVISIHKSLTTAKDMVSFELKVTRFRDVLNTVLQTTSIVGDTLLRSEIYAFFF